MSLWFSRPAAPKAAARTTFDAIAAQISAARESFADVDATAGEVPAAVAVFASTDLMASLISELPIDVIRGSGSDQTILPTPWWLEDPDGSGHGRPDWAYQVLMAWLLRGNMFGDVLSRSSTGFLQQVSLLHPDAVGGWVEDGAAKWSFYGREFTGNMLHRRVNPVTGQVRGLSPIALLAASIGVNLASTRYGANWFRDGAHPGGLLTNSEVELTQPVVTAAKERFLAAMRGTREPVVLGKGWKYEDIQVAPEESQFLQTQEFSAAECCRIFGPGIAEVLGYGTTGMTYSNIQDRDLHLLKYSLNKWIRRLERLLSEFLPRPQVVKINRNALLETNLAARVLAYQSALQNAWMTVNEVRDLENRPRVPWGDEPLTLTPPPPAPDDDEDDPAAGGGGDPEE